MLFGRDYYQQLMEAIEDMAKRERSPAKTSLVLLTDDEDEAINHIRNYITANYTVKPRKRLWWLFERR